MTKGHEQTVLGSSFGVTNDERTPDSGPSLTGWRCGMTFCPDKASTAFGSLLFLSRW
jgi:hypothetical protein